MSVTTTWDATLHITIGVLRSRHSPIKRIKNALFKDVIVKNGRELDFKSLSISNDSFQFISKCFHMFLVGATVHIADHIAQ